jgi:hypothetical protein
VPYYKIYILLIRGGTMKVIIIRHSKVKYMWERWYTSDEFDKACKEYDISFVERTEQNLSDFNCKNIYTSTLLRSVYYKTGSYVVVEK